MDERAIRDSLDKQTKALLEEVENHIPVKFTKWDQDHFACQVHKDGTGRQCEAEVFYKEPIEQAKIAHELLHAKTSLILGDNAIMFSVPKPTIPFICLMETDNASNIVNACEHIIFFPEYLDMGYKEEDSFEKPQDIDKRKKELACLVEQTLKDKGQYSIQKVFQYLGLAFSFMFYPNNMKFKNEIKMLRRIDAILYAIINVLKEACSVDIIPENKEYIQKAYYGFANSMNDWFAKAFKGFYNANVYQGEEKK